MLDRTIAPPIQDALNFSFELPPCEKVRGDNGIPFYWLSAGTQDVVEVDWVFKAGLWEETQPGLAQAVANQLKNGTRNADAATLNTALEFYGASLKVRATNDFTFVTLHSLSRHLPHLLPIIKDILVQPTFPDSEWEIFRQNALQHLRINLEKSDFVANREIEALLFGQEHPYGRYTRAESLEALQAQQLRDFHQHYFHSGNCQVFVSGNIDAGHVEQVIHHFGREAWGRQKPDQEKAAHPLQHTAARPIRIELQPDNPQGSVRLSRPFATRQHPDFTPMLILNTVFGGYFGSRLMANIREEKGYTYGIYSALIAYKNAGELLISTEAGKPVCEATIEETFKEMRLLQTTPVDAEELTLVKNYLLGGLLGDLDGPFSLMQRWKNIILNELPESNFEDNIQIFKTIGSEQLMALAQQYLKPEDYFNLVVS